MTNPFGTTRSRVTATHALIASDSHVVAPLASWNNTQGVILISPRMGAGFCQYLALIGADSETSGAADGIERFVFVVEGQVAATVGETEVPRILSAGDYAWLPPAVPHRLVSRGPGRLLVIEKLYEPSGTLPLPEPVLGSVADIPADPFLGDPDARLQPLLPADPRFDMAVNVFTYQPGATLPFVEVHVMEHGLMMLSGGGVYRLDESWYPVKEGDAIWMAPFCAQWFVAAGKTPASYIYYKDVNRDPLAEAGF